MKEPSLFVDDHVKLAQQLTTSQNRSMSDEQLVSGRQLSETDAAADATDLPIPSSDFEFTNRIALDYIWPTVPIGFLVLGTVANLLSIIVFRRREMKKFSSFCYFFYLNCVNLAVLYVTLVRVIGEFNFQIDIRRLSLVTCKLHVFLTYFLGHLSSMLLCSISIDRVISVMFLHRAKLLCTPRVAAWVTLGLVVFNFALSSHFLVFKSGYVEARVMRVNPLGQTTSNSSSPSFSFAPMSPSSASSSSNVAENSLLIENIVFCDPLPGTFYAYIVHQVWKIIDMSIYAFIPFTIMLICSVIIIARVAQQSKKFSKNATKKPPVVAAAAAASSGSTQANQTPLLKANRAPKSRNASEDLISTNMPTTTTLSSSNAPKSSEAGRMSSRSRNLALMLIPVNLLFLAFLAPVVIAMYTYDQLWDDKLTLAIIELLSYCNFTINFFIYFLTSSKFREEFFKFVDEVLKRKGGSSSMTGTTSTANHHSTSPGQMLSSAKAKLMRNGDKDLRSQRV